MRLKQLKVSRWARLAAGGGALLFAGIIYAWSILKAPLGVQFGWSDSILAFNFSLTLCFFGIGGIGGGMLSGRLPARVVLIISGLVTGAGFICASRMSGGSPLALFFFYGILGGTGIGITYTTIIATVNAWFPDRRGVSSGIELMCFGASSLVLGRVASKLISLPSVGWRGAYLVVGLSVAVVLFIASFFISPPAKDEPLPKEGASSAHSERFPPVELSTGAMLRRASFWKMYCFTTLITAVGGAVISFARDVSLTFGASESTAAFLVGLLAVSNGLGRLLSGFTYDKLGRRINVLITGLTSILASAVLLLSLSLGSVAVGVAGICLTGISYGGIPTVVPVFARSFYGSEHFATNYSAGNTLLIPASLGATLASMLLSFSGSYSAVFLAAMAVSAIALVLGLSVKRP